MKKKKKYRGAPIRTVCSVRGVRVIK